LASLGPDEPRAKARFTTRALGPEDWEAFRDVRLHALRTEPGVFLSSYDREAAFLPAEWRSRLDGIGRCMFGLFDGEALIGLTGVITDATDPSGRTALFVASYLRPEHRGRGLSAYFYEARLAWVRAQRQFARVVVSHRAGNEPSRRANQRFGFREVDRVVRTWPDGTPGEEVRYELLVER
jgi:RimJ/RimL family protein N-acetyltransferase